MNTVIFESYDEFCARSDKAVNGVSPDFALKNPDYKEQNKSNLGCWNCEKCKNCVECISCLNCHECNNCSKCRNCSKCFVCSDCISCSRCEMCSNLKNCLSCLSVHYKFNVRYISNTFNKSKDKALENPKKDGLSAIDILVAFLSISLFLFITR